MSVDIDSAENLRRRKMQKADDVRTHAMASQYGDQARTGMALCCGQTAELMRRMVLVHFLRGPTGIAALCLSVLLIVGSAFWPTVGLLVITSREASLIGEKSIEPSCVPVSLKNWLVGYEGQQDDPTLVDLSQRLWAYLGELQKDSNPRHWCGTLHNCSKRVFDETNPTRSSLLYPLNTHYIFLVRRVYGNIHGYHSYAPYQAFFSPGGLSVMAT
ncbi:hypothetical protein CSKR_202067 [Clonorchis sinensis]|uniref:Uncharacterized protein n=1 Tax=Clonorchis sinensis TaxID=79923 RepID=A0A8T1LWH2_CLOSI|nr:hypothetical protein CSKR_202067 [Clonorchis sinensis]